MTAQQRLEAGLAEMAKKYGRNWKVETISREDAKKMERLFNAAAKVKNSKVKHLTPAQKRQLLKMSGDLKLKIEKLKETVTDGYERDFLEAARRSMEVVRYNLSNIC
mgnify:CR=1 FL=1